MQKLRLEIETDTTISMIDKATNWISECPMGGMTVTYIQLCTTEHIQSGS
jgi:hypothetical protein